VIAVLQSHLPAAPTAVRRALVTPYLLAADGLFWNIVRQVTGGLGLTAPSGTNLQTLSSAAGPIGLPILGAAVYYAMLIYAPRQIAEREGGAIEWLAKSRSSWQASRSAWAGCRCWVVDRAANATATLGAWDRQADRG